MKVVGTYNGTGAAVYLCVGMVPKEVKLTALEDADLATAVWNASMRAVEVIEGIRYVGSSAAIQVAALTVGTGMVPYYGGDVMTSSNQTTTAYGEGVYLGWDRTDYSKDLAFGVQSVVDLWTLDTSANRTGHFNADTVASITRIGEGSKIKVLGANDGKLYEAVISAVTAGQGISADEVTLSQAVPSGRVVYIGGMYDRAPVPIGSIAPAGVKINATSVLNVNDEMQGFEIESDAVVA